MIISHKYRFIFIKTIKTAGTSIEAYLSRHCGEDDILTPIFPAVEGHEPRNWQGFYNPLPDFIHDGRGRWPRDLRRFLRREKFFSHIPAALVKSRIDAATWNSYTKFCIERDPVSKLLSHYAMVKSRTGSDLTPQAYLDRGAFPNNTRIYADRNGRVLVDHILRYEALNDELGQIFASLGVPFEGELGVRAKAEYRTDRKGPDEVFTPEQIAWIRDRFSRETGIAAQFGLGFKG